jgi:hypothetical protein
MENCEGSKRECLLHLVLELSREEGEVEWLGDGPEHRSPLLGQRDCGLEDLLILSAGRMSTGRARSCRPSTLGGDRRFRRLQHGVYDLR